MKTLIVLLLLASGSAHAQGSTNGPVTWLGPDRLARLAPPPADPNAFQTHLAEAVLRAVNTRRAQAGLLPLGPDPVLAHAAGLSAAQMRDGAVPNPLNSQALPAGNYGKLGANMWSAGGALDWRAETLAEQAVAAWAERFNMLDPRYGRAGVGTVMAGDRVFAAIVFAQPGDAAVPATAQSYGTAGPIDPYGAARALPGELLNSLNTERTSRGLTTLYVDEALSAIAQRQSEAIAGRGFLGPGGTHGVSVLDRAIQTEPGRTVRMTAGFWRGYYWQLCVVLCSVRVR